MTAAASVVALLILLSTSQCYCDDGVRLPPQQPLLGHNANHNHDNDTVYIITDTYGRVVEGENVTLCAELSRPVDDDVILYIDTYYDYYSTYNEYDYEYIPNQLVTIKAGTTQKKCISIETTNDTNAGEENLEFFYVNWYIFDSPDTVFYHNSHEVGLYSYSKSLVAIEDNDGIWANYQRVLTLTPNATNITVYEGDYSEICVTPNQLAGREVPSLFYVLFDDKADYTADVDYDLQYNHSSNDKGHYGGIYSIAPSENQTCFHFHTKDDDVFEGNEDFSIKLFSFTPTKYNGSDINNGTIDFFDIFNHVNVTDYHDYENENNYDYHDHDYDSFESIRYSEHLYSDTVIPDSLSTIHVTIVDNEAPCLPQKATKPCLQAIEDVACLRIQQEFENHKDDIPKPCQRNIEKGSGILGRLSRYDPHPLENDV